MSERPRKVLFGAAYYHEYQPSPRLHEDLDLMAAANMTVIRVGESTWSQWEPEDGKFDLEWMTPVLDGAHERGISVILGTPTYAVPMWLARRYPEIAAETSTGQPLGWGARQEMDFTHPAFRFHAERVVRKIMNRFSNHPSVIGYQVDNEPGLLAFHNRGVFQRFTDELRHQYGTVENLNKEWGLVYWSHQLSTWADLWTPDNNAQPQYDLAWRRFQVRLTTEFLRWQSAIVREYATPEQFVTTCIAYDRPSQHDQDMTKHFDITAGNPYYAMQDALAVPATSSAHNDWATSGAWTLFQSGDRMYSSKQAPFLITETNAGGIGGSDLQNPGFDGQWRQAAYAFISRGAEMIEYWHWATNHYGNETYWIGVLPHDQKPGRVYRELTQIGAELKAVGKALIGLTPDASIGMVYSNDSKWGLAGQPCFRHEGSMKADERSYQKIFEAFYQGAFHAGVPVRILHDRQIIGDGVNLDPAQVAKELPVLIAAGLYITDDKLLEWLAAYAEAGGNLVLGIRTAYADHEARARVDAKPSGLAEQAGVSYQEFSQLAAPLALKASMGFHLSQGSRATRWIDYLEQKDGATLASYAHPEFSRYPAITTRATGAGQITTVGTLPNVDLAADLIRWLAPERNAGWENLPESVTVHSATNGDGHRLHFIHNWCWEPITIASPVSLDDLLDPNQTNLVKIELGAWGVRVLIEHG